MVTPDNSSFGENQPLFTSEENNNNDTKKIRENRFELLRRRYFSEIPLTNNPLSKMKKNLTFHRKKQQSQGTKQQQQQQQQQTSSSTTDENIIDERRHTETSFDSPPQVNKNDMKFEESRLTFTDNFSDMDDDVELIADENQNRYDRRDTVSKAADFVKRRTNFLRKTHIKSLKNKYFDKQQQQQQQHKHNLDKNTQKESIFDLQNNSKNTSSCIQDLNRSSEKTTTTTAQPKRFIWKNARKRVRYVVRLIRRESKPGEEYFDGTDEDDEVMLIEENNGGEFLAPYSSPYRFRSRSLTTPPVTSQQSLDENERETMVSFTALNIKYLSPKGRKLDRFATDITPRSSVRSSRRGSVDSGILSKKYLNKSKSLDSVKATAKTATENEQESGDLHDFEQLYLSTNDVSYHDNNDEDDDMDLHCIQNNLYNSTGDDELEESGTSCSHPRQLFEVADEEIDDIIADEVNSYITVDQHHKNLQKQRRASEIFHFSEFESSTAADSLRPATTDFSNIKHTSSLSYSVNNLYDLFNTDRFLNFETSFGDL